MNKLLGETLKDFRRMHGYKLREVSAGTGLSISFISDLERGRSNPSIKTLELLAEYYGTQASTILAGAEMRKGGHTQELGALHHGSHNHETHAIYPVEGSHNQMYKDDRKIKTAPKNQSA